MKAAEKKTEYRLVLWIYTERDYENKLDIPSEDLQEDIELFVIPGAKLGDPCFLVIDNAREKNCKFYEINISDDMTGSPTATHMP